MGEYELAKKAQEKFHEFEEKIKQKIQEVEESIEESLEDTKKFFEDTRSYLEHQYHLTKERISKVKVRIWQAFLAFTIIFYAFGISFVAFGTFSSEYTIERVRFSTQISYERAMENRDLLFNNVSILPDTLEVYTVTAYLISPTNPANTPMPGIVWSHGMTVNAEINLHNALEFASAGFKVLAINLPGHGDSGGLWDFGLNELQAIWSAVEYLAALPDVDGDKIGVAGHSNGGMAVSRAGIFDKTPFGTGGKIKAVGAIWSYTDLEDTLTYAFGTNPIDDPDWGIIISTFFGCKNGIITSEDVARRSIVDFINVTNIPNYYVITGDDDLLTSVPIQFTLFEQATGGAITAEELETLYAENPELNIANIDDPTISFANGTARKLSIRPGQDHVDEVMSSENTNMLNEWMVQSLGLDPGDHIPRSERLSFNVDLLYLFRVLGSAMVMFGTVLLIVSFGYLASKKFYPRAVACVPEFVPLVPGDVLSKDALKFCDDNGIEYRVDYVGDPEKFINSWKKKTLYLGIIILCFIVGISISWQIQQYYFNLWLINLYLWQYFWTGIFLLFAGIGIYVFIKKGDRNFSFARIDLKKMGFTKNGIFSSILFNSIIIGIPLIIYNLLALLLRIPLLMPRPFSWSQYLQVSVTFIMILIFYLSLEFISKSQLFNKDYAYTSLKGYLQEIFINGSLIWGMWILSYLIGGVFLNQKLVWLLFQGNTGSTAIWTIGMIMIAFQGMMAYISAFAYQITRNIVTVALLQALIITLAMTGKFVFIYSVV